MEEARALKKWKTDCINLLKKYETNNIIFYYRHNMEYLPLLNQMPACGYMLSVGNCFRGERIWDEMLQQFMINNMQEPFSMEIKCVDFDKRHWHDNAFEFVLVLKGSVHASLSTEKYKLEENDLLIVSPEDVHSFSKIDEDNIVLFFQINYEYHQNIFPNINQWILDAGQMGRASEHFQLKALRYYLSKLFYHLPDSKNPLVELIPFLSFCEENFQSTNMVSKKADITEKQMEIFYEIDDYIYNHFTDPIQLTSISEFLNYNKYHFSHLVKKITGMNFLDYLNHVRVLAAERFLIITDKKISEIAFECGFTDIRSLNRYFKKWYSCTPSQYRRLYCESPAVKEETNLQIYTLQDQQVKEKLDLYISQLEKIKEINLQKDIEKVYWEMPVLIYIDEKADHWSRQKQSLLQDVLRECNFKKVLSDKSCENEIEILNVTDFLKNALECKIKAIHLFGEHGLVTDNGIKKPSYFAFFLLSKMSKSLIYLEEGFAVGQDDLGIQILLYNASTSKTLSDHYLVFEILLSHVNHDYKVKKYYLNEESGNAHYYLKELGDPSNLSSEDEELIKKITFPKVSFGEIKNHKNIKFHESLSFQSAVLITLEKV